MRPAPGPPSEDLETGETQRRSQSERGRRRRETCASPLLFSGRLFAADRVREAMIVATARSLVVADSVLDLIGHTPMVKLSRFAGAGAAEIWAKCEFLNPGGSVKDRLGLGMILEAE